VVDRTIDRWVETGILPQPIYINNRRYFDLQEVDERMANRNEGPPRVVRLSEQSPQTKERAARSIAARQRGGSSFRSADYRLKGTMR
jgi:hypothetical protein